MDDNLVSKTEANYKVAGEGESPCATCSQFIPPDACKLVSGTISDKATCDMYSPQEQSSEDLSSMLFGGSDGES